MSDSVSSRRYDEDDFSRLDSDLLRLRLLMRRDMSDLLSSPDLLIRRLDSLESRLPLRSDFLEMRYRVDEVARGLVAVSNVADSSDRLTSDRLVCVESRLGTLSDSLSVVRDDLSSLRTTLSSTASSDSVTELGSRIDYICGHIESLVESSHRRSFFPTSIWGRLLFGILSLTSLTFLFLVTLYFFGDTGISLFIDEADYGDFVIRPTMFGHYYPPDYLPNLPTGFLSDFPPDSLTDFPTASV